MPRVFYSKCPIQQPDAVLSQTNPVSVTLYPALATKKNVIIYGISVQTTGGTTSLLEIVITIDGNVWNFSVANPVSGTFYYPRMKPELAENAGVFLTDTAQGDILKYREGKSVKIEARVTWTVQPSPLASRVKWAKIP